jgi:hypothetical protein
MSAGAILVMSLVLTVVFGGVIAALVLAYLQERSLPENGKEEGDGDSDG